MKMYLLLEMVIFLLNMGIFQPAMLIFQWIFLQTILDQRFFEVWVPGVIAVWCLGFLVDFFSDLVTNEFG